jgi:hypothetical protein
MKAVATVDCLGTVANAMHTSSTGVHIILYYIRPMKQIPSTYQTVSSYLAKLPMVFEHRSGCRRR